MYPGHVGMGPSKNIPIKPEYILKFLSFNRLHEGVDVCGALAFL